MYIDPQIIIFTGAIGLAFIVIAIAAFAYMSTRNKDDVQELEKGLKTGRFATKILMALGGVLAALSCGLLGVMLFS